MEKGILANTIEFKKINNELSNELRHNTNMMILVSFKSDNVIDFVFSEGCQSAES